MLNVAFRIMTAFLSAVMVSHGNICFTTMQSIVGKMEEARYAPVSIPKTLHRHVFLCVHQGTSRAPSSGSLAVFLAFLSFDGTPFLYPEACVASSWPIETSSDSL